MPNLLPLSLKKSHLVSAIMLFTAASARAAPECPATGDLGPCYTNIDYLTRGDYAGGNDGGLTSITPQIVATDLGVPAPSYDKDTAVEVFANPSAPNGRLLVFAPGQPDPPKHYIDFAMRAAQRGYNVIVIHYWNAKDDASSALCSPAPAGFTQDSCLTALYEGWFRNLAALPSIFTNYPSSGFYLMPQDQLQNRLRKTLLYLAKHFPNQGWNKFAADGNDGFDTTPYIDWSKVTVAGHSTGSKLMAHVAQDVAVHRLIMLSGPNGSYLDGSGHSQCPSGILIGATPASSMYAYYNLNDSKSGEAHACHEVMGLDALGRDSIDDAYITDNAHVIYNSAIAQNNCQEDPDDDSHLSTAEDCGLIPDQTTNILAPSYGQTTAVWDYLLTR